MDIVRNLNRRVGRIAATTGILLATVAPALMPVVVSADTLTERAVSVGSSITGATTSYKVTFKTVAASTDGFAIDFCTTPTVGTACTAPTGLDSSGVGAGTGVTAAAALGGAGIEAVKVDLASTASAGATVTAELTGIKNPTAAGVYYARVVSYDTYADAANYTAAALGTGAQDQGTVALSTADGFAVDGKVLETLTFCVSGQVETDCSDTDPADVSLGTSGVLDTTAGTDGNVYSYIATNAANGAVVNLQSDALGCGGLIRKGSDATDGCGIAPLTTGVASIVDSSATFGAKLTLTQPGAGDGSTGTLNTVGSWGTNYYMNYDTDDTDATGVTSPYGDTVYNTNSKPTEFAGGELSFNAVRSDLTPAGDYSANFSLIATGKF